MSTQERTSSSSINCNTVSAEVQVQSEDAQLNLAISIAQALEIIAYADTIPHPQTGEPIPWTVEVRIPKVKQRDRQDPSKFWERVVAGWFQRSHIQILAPDLVRDWCHHPDKLAQDARYAEGIYCTLNPVSPELMARSNGRLTSSNAKSRLTTTSDSDILYRAWFPVDIDARRVDGTTGRILPGNISATDEERQKAHNLARRVRDFLVDELGWPAPLLIDSGNGAYAWSQLPLLPIPRTSDGEYDADADQLLHQCLISLAHRFDGAEGVIDTTVANPSRIMKVPGTFARKGEHSQDRPHRRSGFLEIPETITPVSLEQLISLSALAPTPTSRISVPSQTVLGRSDILERARAAANGAVFSALYDAGDTSKYDGNESNADFALLLMLAFWTGKNASLMEELFNASALGQRDKWQDRADYRQRSIAKAIADCQDVYLGSRSIPGSALQARKHHGQATGGKNGPEAGNGQASTGQATSTGGAKTRYPILTPGKNPQWVSCATNSEIWMIDHGRHQIRYNEFASAPEVNGVIVDDNLIIQLKGDIEADIGVKWDKCSVHDAVVNLGLESSYNPLQEYLNTQHWDGTERIATFWKSTFDTPANDYTQAVARHFFIGAVARAFEPGCKVDVMPVLIGDQGIGKSSVVYNLCPNSAWYTDDLGADIASKDAAQGLRAKWIIEFSEFARLNRATNDIIKGFLSRQSDHYRPSYGRIARDFPRMCVFIGTCNEAHPLTDNTGNRRYNPISCRRVDGSLDWVVQQRDQLWAEAVRLYRAGEKWWIADAEVLVQAHTAQDQARQADDWEDMLTIGLADKSQCTMEDVKLILGFTRANYAYDAEGNPTSTLGVDIVRIMSKSDQTRVGQVLSKLGWVRKEKGKHPNKIRYYERLDVH